MSPYVDAEILLSGYLMTPYLSGMRQTESIMGLVPQGFTRILLSSLAMKLGWCISSH